MVDFISWLATAATITAAFMTASNLGPRITGYGFAVFTIGSIAWLSVGLMSGQHPLAWTNVVLTGLNLFGIWRWLGRQTKIEEGGQSAAEASEQSAGDDLFPISLLSRAQIEDGSGNVLGACVDGMAGRSSGRLRYVVASEGGVAGVGETFRRMDWARVSVHGDRLRFEMGQRAFASLERIERDQWPVR